MEIEKKVKSLQSRLLGSTAGQLLRTALSEFGDKIALSSSFSAEDQVVLDILAKTTDNPKVFTLDTGRLPQQTYDLIEQTRDKYGINIEILFPDSEQVEDMVNLKGPNLFYKSIENRKLCCKVRKIEPLRKKLNTLDAWICGLRSGQSITRQQLQKIEADHNFGLIKISPIADWSRRQVWDYIKAHAVPYNKLHDAGYPSIGCACCTRATKPGEDFRSGRWWWEKPEQKECGLHLKTQE